jgi:predicted ATP-grasp superfamily ATP-dependent carboligase
MTPGAIVIGGYANAVSALRSLAREGVRTAVVLTKPEDIAHHSRYAHESHRVLDLHRRPDGLIDLLQDQGARWRGWALIPTNDHALTALAEHRELLSRWYPPTVPEAPIVRQVVIKSNTYRVAREVGLDVPHWYGPASRLTAMRRDIVYPVVVKPLQGAALGEVFGTRLFVAHSPLELIAAIDQLERAGLSGEVFDLIPGTDRQFHNYTVYIDRYGQPVAEFSFRKLRKAPPFFGAARAAEAADLPELREPTIALLQRIGWRGIASAEYKLDPRDGRYRLIGINGRCYLSHALATRCGVNYPLLAWQEYARRQRVSARPNGWRGTWFHLHADLLYAAFQQRGSDWSWGDLVRGYVGPWVDAVWSAADPGPFAAQWVGTLRKAAREIREGREMETVRARLQTKPAATAG